MLGWSGSRGNQCGESEIRKRLGNTPGEFRIQSHTSNLLNLVWFSDLKFLNVNAMKILGTSNPPHWRRTRTIPDQGATTKTSKEPASRGAPPPPAGGVAAGSAFDAIK